MVDRSEIVPDSRNYPPRRCQLGIVLLGPFVGLGDRDRLQEAEAVGVAGDADLVGDLPEAVAETSSLVALVAAGLGVALAPRSGICVSTESPTGRSADRPSS